MPEEINVPDSFFYFASLNGDRREWLREIFEKNQVYFRKREQLNDPNELRPEIIFEGSEKQIRAYVRELILSKWPIKLSPARRLIEENRLIHLYRNSPDWVTEMLHGILDKVGVFCLTEAWDNELLWAHYADGHRGVAIEFDSSLGLFAVAQHITYTDDAPIINRVIDSPCVMVEKSMLTKGLVWSYEREWRVIARWEDEVRQERHLQQHQYPADVEAFFRNQHGAGHYSIPPQSIQSVTLGANISADNEAWVREVIEGIPSPPKIRRAGLHHRVITIA